MAAVEVQYGSEPQRDRSMTEQFDGQMKPRANDELPSTLRDPEAFRTLWDLCLKDEGWKFRVEKKGITVHTKKTKGTPIATVRGRCLFDRVTPFQIFDLVSTQKGRRFWGDDMFIKGEIAEAIDDMSQIWYQQFKCPWPVSDRDTLTLHQTHLKSDGTYTAVSTQAELPNYPDDPDFIRAHVYPSGFTIVPVRDAFGKMTGSMVHYVVCSDPRGWIPKWAVNTTSIRIPMALAGIRDYLQSLPCELPQ
eukprot:gnl/Hemi2/16698_TR5600_c0_g1_i1.p1 gnl/Hemi2/16698_TR5600_c0_g1~~gnl/Hemi2/16698_TR5600_c0_g1_i1.p1  ORF type:complete len:283 (+),score=93.42 gnl/Hemi2/16698_TR5600_c0_g1_i1:106-849(+)